MGKLKLSVISYFIQFAPCSRNKMRGFTLVFLVAAIVGATQGSSIRSRRAVEDFVRSITYTVEKKVDLKQTVTVNEHEARFQVKDGMDAVIDYKQGLFIYTDAAAGSICHVAKFDVSIVPKPQEIKRLIEQQGNEPFMKPESSKAFSYRRSNDQTSPKLLALSKNLCEGKKIVRMEQTTGTTREKREVGAGEVVVIIIAIVVLGFLG